MNVFDIIGPVMIGPSSSHTAGAARLGYVAYKVLGEPAARADITLSGSFMPQRFKSLVDKFGNDPDAMKQAGIAYATDQIIDLYANGISHVHVYSMNKPDVARQIQANLSDILGK